MFRDVGLFLKQLWLLTGLEPFQIKIRLSHSPIFLSFLSEIVDVDRWVPRAAILVSWCERNWGEYIMPAMATRRTQRSHEKIGDCKQSK